LLLAEAVLCTLIIFRVSYTEIDWRAYMDEVGGFLDGERDYLKLKGDTGPLVYPAGFVYLFSLLSYITNGGSNIRLAQFFFAGLYIVTQGIIFVLYRKAKIPPYVLVLLCLSKRLHSIYLLRLFNDPVAMLPMYLSLWALCSQKYRASVLLFSLGVSIKMNVLLFLPALLFLLTLSIGLPRTVGHFLEGATLQALLGLPFLLKNPSGYLIRSFEMGRVFTHRWTVQWRFLSVETFTSSRLAIALLLIQASLLLIFLFYRWLPPFSKPGFLSLARQCLFHTSKRPLRTLSSSFILVVAFTANAIGVICARSLHYQFYAWYFSSLPLLLWSCPSIPLAIRFLWLAIMEWAWNVYPSTTASSLAIHALHLVLLYGL
ncbi:glycosyltransferase, partial [Piptocephalis cylindrospora]